MDEPALVGADLDRDEHARRVLRERIVVVLVRPLQSGNIGSAARAMKNMGLRRLVIVAPPAFDIDRARWMAPGAEELLDHARFVPDVGAAVADCRFVVATLYRPPRAHRRGGRGMGYRVGVDIGGTFADFCAFDEATGALRTLKVLSRPDAPGSEVMEGIRQLRSRFGIEPAPNSCSSHF